MFLAGLFITVLYSVSYLAFAITGRADRKLPIVMNSSRHLHSFHKLHSKILGSCCKFTSRPLWSNFAIVQLRVN